MKKTRKKVKKRILGIDRALMMLCRVARKYWQFYSPVRADVVKQSICNMCAKVVPYVEVDHFPALGPRPRTIQEFADWWERLMNGPQRGLCKAHHTEITKKQREERRKVKNEK